MIEIIPNWHPFFVHFTVALLVVAIALFVLAFFLKDNKWKDQWLTAAHWNLWLGIGLSILTVLAGWYAYNTVAHDTPSHAAMTNHRNWALITMALFISLGIWSIYRNNRKRSPNLAFLFVAVLGLSLLMTTGWQGGELVYRYGLGVMSMPKTHGGGDGHDHEHADTLAGHHDGQKKEETAQMHSPAQPGTANQDILDVSDSQQNGHDNSDGHHSQKTASKPGKQTVKADSHVHTDGKSH